MLRKLAITMAAGLGVLSISAAALALDSKVFDGEPKIVPGSANAAYVWRDAAGYHVRFTTKKGDKPRLLYGTVCTGKEKMDWVKPVLLEKGEHAVIGPHRHCVVYRFLTYTHIDGFDFRTKGKTMTFDFRYDKGARVPPQHIGVGKKQVRPKASPFLLTP